MEYSGSEQSRWPQVAYFVETISCMTTESIEHKVSTSTRLLHVTFDQLLVSTQHAHLVHVFTPTNDCKGIYKRRTAYCGDE